MALYHKWDVKNDFAYVLQFFSLIYDSLASVRQIMFHTRDMYVGLVESHIFLQVGWGALICSDAGTGGPGGPLSPPQYLADQLTLFQAGEG